MYWNTVLVNNVSPLRVTLPLQWYPEKMIIMLSSSSDLNEQLLNQILCYICTTVTLVGYSYFRGMFCSFRTYAVRMLNVGIGNIFMVLSLLQ